MYYILLWLQINGLGVVYYFLVENGSNDASWVVGVAILMFVGFYETLNSGINSHKYKAVKILRKNGYAQFCPP